MVHSCKLISLLCFYRAKLWLSNSCWWPCLLVRSICFPAELELRASAAGLHGGWTRAGVWNDLRMQPHGLVQITGRLLWRTFIKKYCVCYVGLSPDKIRNETITTVVLILMESTTAHFHINIIDHLFPTVTCQTVVKMSRNNWQSKVYHLFCST